MKPLLLVLPPLLVAGCRNPAPGYVPVPPPIVKPVSLASVRDAKDLMPLAVGNHWSYVLDLQNFDKRDKPLPAFRGKAEIDIAARWPNGTGVLVLTQNGNVIDRQAWYGDASGLYQVEGDVTGVPYRPILPAFTLPLKAGKRFAWSGRGPMPAGDAGRGRAECEILAPQNVDLAKGTVSAVPIVTRMTYPGGDTVSTSWFQPGVGLVRLQQETSAGGERSVSTLTLIQHTTKS